MTDRIRPLDAPKGPKPVVLWVGDRLVRGIDEARFYQQWDIERVSNADSVLESALSRSDVVVLAQSDAEWQREAGQRLLKRETTTRLLVLALVADAAWMNALLASPHPSAIVISDDEDLVDWGTLLPAHFNWLLEQGSERVVSIAPVPEVVTNRAASIGNRGLAAVVLARWFARNAQRLPCAVAHSSWSGTTKSGCHLMIAR